MNTEIDPIRWTASPEEAPELLRGPLAAASKEGPSPAQMRMLALKLAAVSAGAAAAATASTAQASAAGASTAGGVAAAPVAALPFVKIIAAVAVVGVAAWGGSSLLSKPSPVQSTRPSVSAPAAPVAADGAAVPAGNLEQGGSPSAEPAIEVTEAEAAKAANAAEATEATASRTALKGRATATKSPRATLENGDKPVVAAKSAAAAAPREAHEQAGKTDVPSEVELLRKARAALASRPREAYSLTEQHREHYPRGVFAQERDALAIEALLRAGDTDAARGLAKSFVSAHPNSPHAHRFRETLGLR